MSKIRVYVRCRPALPEEFDAPGSFNCCELEERSGNWIRIQKEGDPVRYFDRCWGPKSSQEEIFRTVGINTINDVFEGFHGCIFCYGQTGTGKTFTLGCTTPGLEGLQPRCMRYIFEKIRSLALQYDVRVVQQYLQLYQDKVQDLMNIDNDDLQIKADEKEGATVEGATCREVRCYEESISFIQQGDVNRATANTKLNSASSRSHACLITDVHRRERGGGAPWSRGRLVLVDLAGSERVFKSGVTTDQKAYKEAVSINLSLAALGNCISGIVNSEKAMRFKDSKLTRVLQHSLTGHGRTSVILTIQPVNTHMQETICTLKFGERAQKVEAQMTSSSFRDKHIEWEGRLAEQEKTLAAFSHHLKLLRQHQADVALEAQGSEEELRHLETKTKIQIEGATVAQMRAIEVMEEDWKLEEAKMESAAKEEIEALRSANAAALQAVDEAFKTACQVASQKYFKEERALEEKIKECRQKNSVLLQEVELFNTNEARGIKEKASAALAQAQALVNAYKRRLRGCTAAELEEKRASSEALLAALQERLLRLQTKALWSQLNRDKRAYGFSRGEAATAVPAYIADLGKHKDSDSITDITVSPAESSSEDPFSSSASAGSSDTSSEEVLHFRPRRITAGDSGPAVPKAGRKEFDVALAHEAELQRVLDGTLEFLEYGSTVYILQLTGVRPTLEKRHMFLADEYTVVTLAPYDAKSEPDMANLTAACKVSDINSVTLGQFSPSFRKALEGAPIVPLGTPMPKNCKLIDIGCLSVFFYRSMSLSTGASESIIDVVFNTDNDFEAWLVSLHRLTKLEPTYGGGLDITLFTEASRLTDDEAQLCSTYHIQPSKIWETKKLMVSVSQQPQLFCTLFDIRNMSSLDLYRSQKVLEHFLKCGWLEQVCVYHNRYPECIQEQQDEKSGASPKKKTKKSSSKVQFVDS